MPEVNNSLAAQIQVPQIDAVGSLLKAQQFKNLNTENELKQQELKYRQGVLDRNNQYYPQDINTLAEAKQKHLDNAGRIGSAYISNPTDANWSASVDEAERVGLIQGGTLGKAQYLALPPQQRAAVAQSLMKAGQPSQATIEQTGVPAGNRAEGAKIGELRGGLTQAPDTGEPAPNGQAKPKVSLIEANKAAEGSADVDRKQLEQYQQEGRAAGTTKAALLQMKLDAQRVRTGSQADKEQGARKFIIGLGDTFPSLRQYGDKFKDSTAAFESLDKNAGIVAREAQKSVSGTAASELDAISKTLASTATTNKGIDVNVSQLMGLKNYEAARASAAENYYQGGTMKGFAGQFNKNAGPAAWIFMALPPEEQDTIKAQLNKSDAGKRTWGSIIGQIHYIHKNKLDEGLD